MPFDFDETLGAARSGDAGALNKLITYAEDILRRETEKMLKRSFRVLYSPGHTAEQVASVQNKVWLKMLEGFRKGAKTAWLDPTAEVDEQGFLRWLRVAIRHTLLDAVVKSRREASRSGQSAESVPDGRPAAQTPDQLAAEHEQMELFWKKVGQLSGEDEVIFDMMYLRSPRASYKAIAAVTGLAPEQVSRRWTRIMLDLRLDAN